MARKGLACAEVFLKKWYERYESRLSPGHLVAVDRKLDAVAGEKECEKCTASEPAPGVHAIIIVVHVK